MYESIPKKYLLMGIGLYIFYYYLCIRESMYFSLICYRK